MRASEMTGLKVNPQGQLDIFPLGCENMIGNRPILEGLYDRNGDPYGKGHISMT